MSAFASPTGRRHMYAAAFLLIAMAAIVGAANGFQYIGGFIPCKLCLEERIPYYAGVPLMLLAALAVGLKWPPAAARLFLLAGAALMTWSLYMGVYHAGVEWRWWAGPTDCGAVAAPDTGGHGVLDAINTFVPPACDQAAGRFLGLSFAGWNAVASLILAAVAWWATFSRRGD